MNELTINYNICNGQKSCGRCEDHIQGFISVNRGKISTDDLDNETLDAALKDCPTGALQVE